MTKDQCAALINAMKETAIYLSQSLVFLRNAVARKVADEDYVEGLEGDYSDAIDEIVEAIPDDASGGGDGGSDGGGGET